MIGHSDWVRAIAISRDGKYLVSGSNYCTVRLWDIETGQIIYLFKGHKQRVKCVQFNDDGKQIITGSADSTLKVWNLETGVCLKTIRTSLNPKTVLNAVALNFKENQIATGSTSVQGTVKCWDLQTGEMIDAVNAAFSGINSLAISSDGKVLVSGSGGKTIKIWHLDRGLNEPLVIHNAHLGDAFSFAIHNNTLVSGENIALSNYGIRTGESYRLIFLKVMLAVFGMWQLAFMVQK